MQRLIPKSFPVFRACVLAALFSAICLQNGFSDPEFKLMGQTNDRVKSFKGGARLGSFGAPSLNDKGAVAFACILAGTRISAFTSNSLILKRSAKKPPKVAIQAGFSVDDSFLPVQDAGPNVFSAPGSGQIFRMSRTVALNNKDQIGFAGELLYLIQTDTVNDMGVVTDSTFQADNRSVYGTAIPIGSNRFQTFGLVTYDAFFEEILQRTLSINKEGSVAFNGTIILTPTKQVPGFSYSGVRQKNDGSYTFDGKVIATVESNVIGLPFFTVFTRFSDAIIADQNKAFVVADISDDGSEFDGIWQGNNPDVQPVVVKNSKAPSGGTFESFDGKIGPSRNAKLVAFVATLSDTDANRGVFRSGVTGDNLIRIAGAGDKAPGNTASGNLGNFTDFELAAVSNQGYVAVLGNVENANGTGERTGIWLSDEDGQNLELIVVEGQEILVGKDLKKITKIAFNPVSGLNKRGQVAFTASFTDRTSAVFVAQL